jgi:hypothetical protein
MKWKCEYVVRWTPTVNRRDWVSERVLRSTSRTATSSCSSTTTVKPARNIDAPYRARASPHLALRPQFPQSEERGIQLLK